MALRQSLIHPSHDCSLIRLKARLVKMLGFVGSFRILWAACNQLVPVDYEIDGHTRWYIRLPRPCSHQLGNICQAVSIAIDWLRGKMLTCYLLP